MATDKVKAKNKKKIAEKQKAKGTKKLCTIRNKSGEDTTGNIITVELYMKNSKEDMSQYEDNLKGAWMILMHRLIDEKATGLNDKYLNDFNAILNKSEIIASLIEQTKGKIIKDFDKNFILIIE